MIVRRRIGVIDVGVGNLTSVGNALREVGSEPLFITTPGDAKGVHAVILPGVGSFHHAMTSLRLKSLDKVLHAAVQENQPVLGVCLGMQLLMETGCEGGDSTGLGVIPGGVNPLPATSVDGKPVRTPHIGWRALTEEHHLPKNRYYFAHSYMVTPKDAKCVYRSVNFYGFPVPAMVGNQTVWGVQFHPERSSSSGLKILANFVHTGSPL